MLRAPCSVLLAVLVAALALAAPRALAADCGTWSPGVAVSPTLNIESKSFTAEWTVGGPVGCTNGGFSDDWDGTHHLMLRRAEGSTPPSATGGDKVGEFSPSTLTAYDLVHRSGKTYAYALFACENSSCSSYYDDGTGALEKAENTADSDTTALEQWVLDGVSGESDIESVVVDNPAANAPHAFAYPSDWGSGLSDRLGIYYSHGAECDEEEEDGQESEIYYIIHDDSGWPTSAINDPSNWSDPTLVAEGSGTATDVDYHADHPWAMLTRDGSDKRIQLLLQSQHSCTSSDMQTIQVESADEVGDDFNLDCTDTGGCGLEIIDDEVGYVSLEADGTSATDYVVDAQHSRVYWDYIDDPYIDVGTDYPFMMFQMRVGGGSCTSSGVYDDIGWADAGWDTGASEWYWDPQDTSGCADIEINDGHDNTMIPLPGGEFKMYYKTYPTPVEEWHVIYWDGSTWGDEVEIEFYWDGSGGPDYECIENAATMVHATGGPPDEYMFFMLMDSDHPDCGTGLDETDDGTTDKDRAIVHARLDN